MSGPRAIPGRFLIHPAPAAAAAIIAINDFVIKPTWPGVLSGKLSDIGICFLFPLVIAAGVDWLAWLVTRLTPLRLRWPAWVLPVGACAIAAGYYAALELSPTWGELHQALIAALGGASNAPVTRDLTDLLCLPLVVLAGVFLRRQRERPDA